MTPEIARRIDAIASDRTRGASALTIDAVHVLQDAAFSSRADLEAAIVALCRAQPCMAPVWNAAAAAWCDVDDPGALDRFIQRLSRAPMALARVGATALLNEAVAIPSGDPFRVVTFSSSRAVLACVLAAAEQRLVHVSCAEGRPGLEGAAIAESFARAGVPVDLFGDAAISVALDAAHVVVVGADAVAPDWFINKSGTRLVAAAASPALGANQQGVARSVLVAASRDKFVGRPLASRLTLRESDPAEVCEAPAAGVRVRNPYFEKIEWSLVAGVITDAGLLSVNDVAAACEAEHNRLRQDRLISLLERSEL